MLVRCFLNAVKQFPLPGPAPAARPPGTPRAISQSVQISLMSLHGTLFGHGGMADVSPYRAPKRKLPEALAVPAFNGP